MGDPTLSFSELGGSLGVSNDGWEFQGSAGRKQLRDIRCPREGAILQHPVGKWNHLKIQRKSFLQYFSISAFVLLSGRVGKRFWPRLVFAAKAVFYYDFMKAWENACQEFTAVFMDTLLEKCFVYEERVTWVCLFSAPWRVQDFSSCSLPWFGGRYIAKPIHRAPWCRPFLWHGPVYLSNLQFWLVWIEWESEAVLSVPFLPGCVNLRFTLKLIQGFGQPDRHVSEILPSLLY